MRWHTSAIPISSAKCTHTHWNGERKRHFDEEREREESSLVWYLLYGLWNENAMCFSFLPFELQKSARLLFVGHESHVTRLLLWLVDQPSITKRVLKINVVLSHFWKASALSCPIPVQRRKMYLNPSRKSADFLPFWSFHFRTSWLHSRIT